MIPAKEAKPQGLESTMSIFSDDSMQEILIPLQPHTPPVDRDPSANSEEDFQPSGHRKRAKKDNRGLAKNWK